MGFRKPGDFAEALLRRLVPRPKMRGCSKVGNHQLPMVPGDELQPDQGREIGADLDGIEVMGGYRFGGAFTATGIGQRGGHEVRKQLPL